MICKASSTVVSGDTDSGFGVMIVVTSDSSNGSSFAIALDIMSLKETMPTSRPSSTTSAALRASDIIIPASRQFVPGRTIVAGRPANRLRSVGEDLPPNAWAIKGPNNCCKAAACAFPAPCTFAICFTASSAALLLFSCARSSLVIASSRHLPISRRPTTAPLSSTTGKWRKRFSTIVARASIAESDIDTHVGFGVITLDTPVDEGSRYLATTRRVISVSDKIPATPPAALVIKAASPRLFASIFATSMTLSLSPEINGFFGRKDFTVLSLFFFVVVTFLVELVWDVMLGALFGRIGWACKFTCSGIEFSWLVLLNVLFIGDVMSLGVVESFVCCVVVWGFWTMFVGTVSFCFSFSFLYFCSRSSSWLWISSALSNLFSLIASSISFLKLLTSLSNSCNVGRFCLRFSNSSSVFWKVDASLNFFWSIASCTFLWSLDISSSNSTRLSKHFCSSSIVTQCLSLFSLSSFVSSVLLFVSLISDCFSFSIVSFFSRSSMSSCNFPALSNVLLLIASSISFFSASIWLINSLIVGNSSFIGSISSKHSWTEEAFLKSLLLIASSISFLSLDISASISARDEKRSSFLFSSFLLSSSSLVSLSCSSSSAIKPSAIMSSAVCPMAAPAKSLRLAASAMSCSAFFTAASSSLIVGRPDLFWISSSSFCWSGAHSVYALRASASSMSFSTSAIMDSSSVRVIGRFDSLPWEAPYCFRFLQQSGTVYFPLLYPIDRVRRRKAALAL